MAVGMTSFCMSAMRCLAEGEPMWFLSLRMVSGGSASPTVDPGRFTLAMMRFLYKFIELYPGWTPLQYLTALLVVFKDQAEKFGAPNTNLGHGRYQALADYLFGVQDNNMSMGWYKNDFASGHSTFHMLKYNTATGVFSYVNVGDSGSIILRPNENQYYEIFLETKKGNVSPNQPFALSFQSLRKMYLTKLHSSNEDDETQRHGRIPTLHEADLSDAAQSQLSQTIKNYKTAKGARGAVISLVNVLPETKPEENKPGDLSIRVKPGDVVISASDGLLDNLHGKEIEAIVTLEIQKWDQDRAPEICNKRLIKN